MIHVPQAERKQDVLEKRIAAVQGEFILSYIQRLHCPYRQKMQLMDEMMKQLAEKAEKKERKHGEKTGEPPLQ